MVFLIRKQDVGVLSENKKFAKSLCFDFAPGARQQRGAQSGHLCVALEHGVFNKKKDVGVLSENKHFVKVAVF